MPRSYLDGVDLRALRRAGEEAGPAGLVLACLLEGGVAEHDPDDPEWSDRDRVLVDPALPLRAVAGALERAGYPADDGRMGQGPGRVMAEALRAARASQAAGDVYRVFVVLDGASLGVGAVWEALLEAAFSDPAPLTPLTLLVPTWKIGRSAESGAHGRAGSSAVARSSRLEIPGVLKAAGWRVEAAAPEPAEVLGGLDRLLGGTRGGTRGGPGALVVSSR